jgi:hypothetical protein
MATWPDGWLSIGQRNCIDWIRADLLIHFIKTHTDRENWRSRMFHAVITHARPRILCDPEGLGRPQF